MVTVVDTTWLDCPGVAPGEIARSDYAVHLPGSFDVRVKVQTADWTFPAEGSLIGQWLGMDWLLTAPVGGLFLFAAVTNLGMDLVNSTATPLAASGGTLVGADAVWLRGTLLWNNGAGGHTFSFYYGFDGSTWFPVGVPVVVAGVVLNMAGIAADLHVGGHGGVGFPGRIYEAQVRSPIDGPLIANPCFDDPRVWPQGTAVADDAQGNTWTLTGTTIDHRRHLAATAPLTAFRHLG